MDTCIPVESELTKTLENVKGEFETTEMCVERVIFGRSENKLVFGEAKSKVFF